MPPYNGKVLIVGTTPDYINRIRHYHPGKAFFLTDPEVRQGLDEKPLPPTEEMSADFSDYAKIAEQLENHLGEMGIHLIGITSYDCESMDAAAYLAEVFELPYSGREEIKNCRNKFLSNNLWHQHQIPAPLSELIGTEEEAVHFYEKSAGSCVLKPINGSGSELVFCCDSATACRENFLIIKDGVNRRQESRMYAGLENGERICLAEETVKGEELSCDFIIEDDNLTLIRVARKIISKNAPFGTARAYILLPSSEPILKQEVLSRSLYRSAKALGIKNAMCMADFIVRDGKPVFLEMAPRPGGDCLPFLLQTAWAVDIFQLNLDFAAGKPVQIKKSQSDVPYIGLRIHSTRQGVLKSIKVDSLANDPRLISVQMIRKPGHKITMPPEDYDSWYLGFLSFRPLEGVDMESQCDQLTKKIEITVI